MMPIVLLLSAADVASAPPPPVSGRIEPQPVSAMTWVCEASRSDHQVLTFSGAFPAISVESQKNGQAYRLQTKMESSGGDQFNGTFATALTSNVLGMGHYNLFIPKAENGRSYIVALDVFQPSKTGFVTVAQFDSAGAPSAYASGLCRMQVIP